ncbi:MAG TPA: erythromycin esterase family protein [Kofleriaceae bacterium]|nr:erythromycin esterase family protein [Kofleriaceae bacterium]
MPLSLVLWLVLWLVLSTVSCGGDSPGIPEGAHRFDGNDVALASDDLDPLWEMVGDARLIGLGESVHTSGGYYAAKHRLIRVLVEEHGVRFLAMESPRDRVATLDEYLVSGDCDRPADEVLLPIAKVFSDDNTYALMRWLCERNAAAPSDPVHVFGFDVRQGDVDEAEIQSTLETWAPDDAPDLLAGIDPCFGLYSDPLPSEAELASCMEALDALDGWVESHRAELVAAAGERAVRLLEIAAISLRAWQGYAFFYDTDPARSGEARDIGMGGVFNGIVNLELGSEGRAAVWAHNVHLTRHHDRIEDSIYFPGTVSFGTVVADAFGDDYAPVALTAYAPGINWPEVAVDDHYDFGTDFASVEARLHEMGEPYLIVDPRASFLRPDNQQLLSEETMIPSDQYAAIVYLDESPPMNAVYW